MKLNQQSLQTSLAKTVTTCLMNKDYSTLATFLEVIAKSTEDGNVLSKIGGIKSSCTFEFESFCLMYRKSFMYGSRRAIRFQGTGERISYERIRAMAQEEFVKPLQDVAIDLLSTLGYSNNKLLTDQLIGLTESIKVKLPEAEVVAEAE